MTVGSDIRRSCRNQSTLTRRLCGFLPNKFMMATNTLTAGKTRKALDTIRVYDRNNILNSLGEQVT